MRGEAARRIARPTGAVDSTIEMSFKNIAHLFGLPPLGCLRLPSGL
jgi:hypothetical protein